MKKLISICLVFCLLTNVFPALVNAEEQSSNEDTKKLIGIIQDKGHYQFEHSIVYNEEELPVEYKCIGLSEGAVSTNVSVSYDGEKRIKTLKRTQYESDGTCTMNEKNDYYYDKTGNFIGINKKNPSNYSYDENGKLLTHITEFGGDYKNCTSTENYIYDSSKKLIEKEIVTDLSPIGMGTSTEIVKYSYDFYPFAVETRYVKGEMVSKEISLIDSILDELIHGLMIDENSRFESEDGYLVKVIGSDYTYEFIYEEPISEYNFQIYSPHQELIVEKDKYLQLICTLNSGNNRVSDWKQPSISVGNADILSYVTCDRVDTGYCITLKGISAGTSTLMIRDDETGTELAVLMHVSDEQSAEYKYVLGMVPVFYPDTFGDGKVKTNFFNYNGLYVTGLENEVESVDGFYELNFNVYNTSYMHGSVDVYNASHEWIESVRLDKNANVGDAWEALEDGFYLLCDLIEGNGSFTASFASTETNVSIKVPEGGYFVISNNIRESPGACMYNCLDLVVWSARKVTGVALNDKGTKDFQDMVIEDIICDPEFMDMYYNEIISSVEGYAVELSGKALKSNYIDIAGNFTNHTIDILAELDIDINKIYSDVAGTSVDLLVKLLPQEVQTAYDFMFGVSEYTDLVGQIHDMCTCFVLDKPCVKIFTPQYTEKISFVDRITNFFKKTS